MAKRKKKATRRVAKKPVRKARRTKRAPVDMIISKSRTKNASAINVSGDFYAALDGSVREMIARAEQRAVDNGRRTLRPHDL